MEEANARYAVVTGGNKGIGFAICRQLASKGITVVLSARDEKKGLEAAQKLQDSGLGDHIVFHQLDVSDPASIAALTDFIKSKFGKLDILVNNAGVIGAKTDSSAFKAAQDMTIEAGSASNFDWSTIVEAETYEMGEECVRINYYGAKRMCKALVPLLQLSISPRIVNVSSSLGQLTNIFNEWAKEVLGDAENVTEERVDEVLNRFLKDFKEGLLRDNGWPPFLYAYRVSKAALNAYTRILAKKHPSFCVNAICPGYIKTDMTHNTGRFTAEDGAACAVRLALLPNGSASGLFYFRMEEASF